MADKGAFGKEAGISELAKKIGMGYIKTKRDDFNQQFFDLGITPDYLMKTYAAQYWKHSVDGVKNPKMLHANATSDYYQALQMGIDDYKKDLDLKKKRVATNADTPGLRQQTGMGTTALGIAEQTPINLGVGIKR